jgi:SAM-dependent MidA family methyltransferase
MRSQQPSSVSVAPEAAAPRDPQGRTLRQVLAEALARSGGWLPFDRFMALALYAPGLGYYSRSDRQFGAMPSSGSDFITAPELSPHFGRAVARQVQQALQASGTHEVFEFGAGTGALAQQLLGQLGTSVRRYTIVDLSGSLRARQQRRLAPWGDKLRWLDAWPEAMQGVAVGNEVLDAMPVQLLHFDGRQWAERGVAWSEGDQAGLVWHDRPTALRPPVEAPDTHFVPGTVTEIHPQAQAFVRSLAQRLQRGAALFLDYGFPAAEYYLPQRHGGTLMCHRGHMADADPLQDVGDKDITAHLDFTGLALAAQDAGLEVMGYTSQAHFLLNCGVLDGLEHAPLAERVAVQRLVHEHEMGELFKVLLLAKGCTFEPLGFVRGDRSHRL